MSQYKTITKQISGIYLIRVLDFALTFLLFVLLTRMLSQYDFGIYSILSVSVMLITGLLTMGLNEFLTRELIGGDTLKKKEQFNQIFSFCLVVTSGATVVLTILSFLILKYLNYIAIFPPFLLVLFSSGITVLGNILIAYTYSEKKPFSSSLMEFLFKSAWSIPILALVFFTALTIDLIFLVKLGFTLCVFSIFLIQFRKQSIPSIRRINWNYMKTALLFSLPLSLMWISQWVITSSDRYILGIFHSAITVANYSYIYSLLNTISLFGTAAISVTLYPYIIDSYNKNDHKKSNFLLNSILKYTLLILLPSLVGFFIMSKEIVTMISGMKYLSAVPLIPYLILFPLVEGISVVYIFILLLQKKTKLIAILYSIGLMLNTVLNFILIPSLDATGAGLSTTITYLFLAIAFFIVTRKEIHFNYHYLKIPRIIISSLVMALSIAFIHPQNIITKLATIILGGVVYIGSLYITKAYVPEELDLIKSFLPWKKGSINKNNLQKD